MKLLFLAGIMLGVLPAEAELREARELMRQNQPGKAGEVIQQLRQSKPTDPWLVYDSGVAAYAAKDYENADAIWEELAARPLPEKLQDKVWMQIGTVSFRRGEPHISAAPELALPYWEQSREALPLAGLQ